jgi:hypothetical protein
MKKAFILLVVIGLVALVVWWQKDRTGVPAAHPANPFNTTYIIEGKQITLESGSAEAEIAPGSASKEVTKIFSEPVYGDLDNDGDDDAIVFLTQNSGGSGTFYYVAAALNDEGVYAGTEALLLGDRIAPQTLDIRDGFAIANYADRKAGDAMTTPPSVGMSLYAAISGGKFVLIAPQKGDKSDLIKLGLPAPLTHISSPLTLSGQARGNWYFEASFPIELTDVNGNVIVQSHANATGDWMTTDFVPFEATLEFTPPSGDKRGVLILRKDNPSGLPEKEDELDIPVVFQ